MKTLKLVRKTVMALVLAGGLLSTVQAQGQKSVPVKLAQVQEAQLAPTRPMPGEIRARYRAELKAETSGTLDTLMDPGAEMTAGDTVATIVDPVYALRLRELQQEVASTSAQVTFLAAETRRLASMEKQNLASPREVEQNRSDLVQAQSRQQAAESRLHQLQETVRRLRVRAPFDGYLVEQLAQPGEYLRAGDPVASVISKQQQVEVYIPVASAAHVSKGQRWQVYLTGGSERNQKTSWLARVTAVVPSAANASRQLQVRLEVPESKAGQFMDGQPAVVYYPIAVPHKAVLVPRDALVLRQQEVFIYRVSDGKAEKLRVQPGAGQGDWIAVTTEDEAALQAGDKVVVRGNERLRHGQPVQVLEE